MTRKLTPGKLVIASHNQGKVREIRDLLAPYGMAPISAGELGLPEPAETGTTFIENALIKAVASAQTSGLVALADDSGLCVDALDGAPGVYTADWAETPQGRDWALAMEKVEMAIRAKGAAASRAAHFSCVLALAWPDGDTAVFEGTVAGSLCWPPRGEKGFGYDPVFVPAGHDISFAEMEPARKHQMSHRAGAFLKLINTAF